MDFSDLLFFTLFGGAWFLLFLKKKQTTSLGSKEKKGVTLRLLEFIAEFKSSLEEQLNEQQSVPARDLPLSREQREAPTKAGTNMPQRKRQTSSATMKNIPEKVIPIPRNEKDKNGLEIRYKFPKKKMQQAIIWSEILKPPIGLQ